MHALLVAYPSNFGEEEAGNFGKVEGELVGHNSRLKMHLLKKIPVSEFRFRLEKTANLLVGA